MAALLCLWRQFRVRAALMDPVDEVLLHSGIDLCYLSEIVTGFDTTDVHVAEAVCNLRLQTAPDGGPGTQGGEDDGDIFEMAQGITVS